MRQSFGARLGGYWSSTASPAASPTTSFCTPPSSPSPSSRVGACWSRKATPRSSGRGGGCVRTPWQQPFGLRLSLPPPPPRVRAARAGIRGGDGDRRCPADVAVEICCEAISAVIGAGSDPAHHCSDCSSGRVRRVAVAAAGCWRRHAASATSSEQAPPLGSPPPRPTSSGRRRGRMHVPPTPSEAGLAPVPPAPPGGAHGATDRPGTRAAGAPHRLAPPRTTVLAADPVDAKSCVGERRCCASQGDRPHFLYPGST